jgi:hypothetical protein
MDWQEVTALVIVGATTGAFVWGRIRRRYRRFSLERDTHCGCSKGEPASAASVIYRARKGERPEIVVRLK